VGEDSLKRIRVLTAAPRGIAGPADVHDRYLLTDGTVE